MQKHLSAAHDALASAIRAEESRAAVIKSEDEEGDREALEGCREALLEATGHLEIATELARALEVTRRGPGSRNSVPSLLVQWGEALARLIAHEVESEASAHSVIQLCDEAGSKFDQAAHAGYGLDAMIRHARLREAVCVWLLKKSDAAHVPDCNRLLRRCDEVRSFLASSSPRLSSVDVVCSGSFCAQLLDAITTAAPVAAAFSITLQRLRADALCARAQLCLMHNNADDASEAFDAAFAAFGACAGQARDENELLGAGSCLAARAELRVYYSASACSTEWQRNMLQLAAADFSDALSLRVRHLREASEADPLDQALAVLVRRLAYVAARLGDEISASHWARVERAVVNGAASEARSASQARTYGVFFVT